MNRPLQVVAPPKGSLLVLPLLIICGATAFVGAVPTQMAGQDNFFLLDNGWRIVCGQRLTSIFLVPEVQSHF